MTTPRISIRLERDDKPYYRPGETIMGEYRVVDVSAGDVRAVEVSVLWYTEGKGDEDLAVHDFDRTATDEGDWIELRHPKRFETVLPRSPMSYNGEIVKIRWCVRVRVFLTRGKEIVGEAPFVLGNVPPVKVVSS